MVLAYTPTETLVYEVGPMCYDIYVSDPSDATQVAAETPGTPSSSDSGDSLCPHYTKWGCSCMRYLTQVKGLDIKGNAVDLVPNIDHPIAGGVLLINYGDVGHAAYIEAVLPNGNFLISEWNYKPGEYTERVIKKDDPRIRGFYYVNPNK